MLGATPGGRVGWLLEVDVELKEDMELKVVAKVVIERDGVSVTDMFSIVFCALDQGTRAVR